METVEQQQRKQVQTTTGKENQLTHDKQTLQCEELNKTQIPAGSSQKFTGLGLTQRGNGYPLRTRTKTRTRADSKPLPYALPTAQVILICCTQ